jgi:hypothetical protein
MADKRISQLIERVTIANNDVLPIVASGATTTNKVTVSTLQDWMQNNLDVGVTSIGITIGSSGTDINVTGSPVTTSGNITINIPTASATNRGLLSSTDWTTFNNKLSSVGLSMPSAFTVSNSPLTANGTITVTGAGTVAQYIRGDGSLADFPEAGGGGASVSYYLNGSVSQGTIGGVAYYEMNKTPILGAGTDFVAIADGYLVSFITDAGDPSLLLIPGGNWNFETYFSASSGGGTPSFYIELYKVDSGGTATLIASNSAVPELIAFGTTITPYFSTLAVPTTVLTLTDRLAIRYYVARSGRTITLHTENSHLCQVITTFTTGLTALNGLTAQVQNFATGTSGTDFAISSVGTTHTFNLPDASASARGVVSTNSQVFTGVKTFSNGLSLPAVGGTNQTTRLVNIGTIHEGSAGSNQIGFNNSNNIYFGKGLSDGGVITWSNSEVRSYTLPNVSGVIALTTNIPTNPVGGSGTINQIPKYTSSTTTIGNSNISDNGSDVVISSRTGISLSGQSILITPNLGGTTNRIETTGSLPLELVTSGASITLAAGGTTPQITLASTGAVTLTGALNGTSASFTGTLTLNGADNRINSGNELRFYRTDNAIYSRIFDAGSSFVFDNRNGNGFSFQSAGTNQFSIASTGAATFSSSVTATANASGRSGLFGGASFGVRIDNSGSFNNGGSTIHGVDNTFVASYQKLSLNGSSLEFMTDYSPRVTITNTGNVGIGTASPTEKLHIVTPAGADFQTAINLEKAGGYGNVYLQSYYTDVPNYGLAVKVGNVTGMVVNGAGQVGIGTTSPADKLEVQDGYINTYHAVNANSAGYGVQFLTNGGGSKNTLASIILSQVGTARSGDLIFATSNASAPTERMRNTSDGYLRMAASSGGIQFNGDTAAANALDDYEEGTWTPSIRGALTAGTYEIATNISSYTKIGRQVTANAFIVLASSVTGGGTGYAQIHGLPFSKANNNYCNGTVAVTGVDYTGTYLVCEFVSVSANSVLYISDIVDSSSPIDLPISAIGANDAIKLTITYFV